MKKVNYSTKDGKVVKGIVTKSTMPNASKKRVRHNNNNNNNNNNKINYRIKINIIPILGCIACIFGDWNPSIDWTILRISLFIINLFLIFELERAE